MACSRCSTCGINYPRSQRVCDVCGDPLDPIGNDQPDEDCEEKVRLARVRGESESDGRVTAWRLWQYVRLGYDPEEAELLAAARADHHRLRRMMDAGCDPETALRILT